MRKPLLIFDGDCGFCRKWISYWQTLTGERVDYAPYQEVAARFPEVSAPDFTQAVQLIETDGRIVSGAHAVFRALSGSRGLGWMNWLYERVPLAAAVADAAYRVVARHRVFFSRVTRLFWGDSLEPARYDLTRRIYLKALGVTYLAAFLSFWTQSAGLVGPQGILPMGWSNGALGWLCAGGAAAALLLILGIGSTFAAAGAWVAYWYVVRAGQEFLGFQWDTLMLEMGFFSVFLTLGRRGPARLSVLLMRWLLFRVVFFSGYVKLASQDPTWRDLTALRYHFETQPLPTGLGWWFHQLPLWALKGCAVGMFAVELAVPFLYFLPRRPRIFAFFATLFLQLLIDGTGNYGFFGMQVVALTLLLLDDAWLKRWLPRLSGLMKPRGAAWLPGVRSLFDAFAGPPLVVAATVLIFLTTVWRVPAIRGWIAPLGVIHDYGVFAVMTTVRREVVFEGSRDGQTWLPYELKWKPGDPGRSLPFCEPHMPRLDWQLWFAALGSMEQNPWVQSLAVRLLENSPDVLALFEGNPFSDAAPRYVRASFYRYHFTDVETRRRTGQIWVREPQGLYLPPGELRHF